MVNVLSMILALAGIAALTIYTVKYIKKPWSASYSYICLWCGIIFVIGGLIIHTIIGDAKFFGKKCCVPSALVTYHKESTSGDVVRLRLLWRVEELQKSGRKWGIRVSDKSNCWRTNKMERNIERHISAVQMILSFLKHEIWIIKNINKYGIIHFVRRTCGCHGVRNASFSDYFSCVLSKWSHIHWIMEDTFNYFSPRAPPDGKKNLTEL